MSDQADSNDSHTSNQKKKSKKGYSVAFGFREKESGAASDQSQQQPSHIFLIDPSFNIGQLNRDLWLDYRRSVQNGTRCIRCDFFNKRYMCTSRSLRDWDEEELQSIVTNFKEALQAQSDVASLTPFVQAVVAGKVQRRDLLVIAPLPGNLYLSDLKKIVVHLSHNAVRYYSACILLGLEFLRHRKIYHGNLSLTSIALDHHGRPQITDLDTLLHEKIGEMSSQLDALRFAALIGVLHCDNIRHFSVMHMHSGAVEDWRRDLFMGICPKCRLTYECLEPKLCDCNNFGALVRLIRGKIVNRDSVRRILDSLQATWVEADLRYSWTCIPKLKAKKFVDTGLTKIPSQLVFPSDRLSRNSDVGAFEEFDEDFDINSDWRTRLSQVSVDVAGSVAGTMAAAKADSQFRHSGVSAWTEAAHTMKQKQSVQPQTEPQQAGSGSPGGQPAKPAKLELMRLSSESAPEEAPKASAAQPAASANQTLKKIMEDSAPLLELPLNRPSNQRTRSLESEEGKEIQDKLPSAPESLNSTPKVQQPRSKSLPSSPTRESNGPLLSSAAPPQSTLQKHWRLSKPSVDLNDEETQIQTKNSTDTNLQSSSSSRTVWSGVVNANASTGDESATIVSGVVNASASTGDESATIESGIPNSHSLTTNCSSALPTSSGTSLNQLTSNAGTLNPQISEFAFDGYQQMMRQPYFSGTNWAALDAAQPPDGLWFANSLLMQSYTREAPQRAVDNTGDETDRAMGSYFTGRSRILYNLFG